MAGLLADKVNLDWYVANQSAMQNVLNNQSTLMAVAFDPTVAGQFFSWAFTGVMLVGFAAWGGGEIIRFIVRVFGGRR